MLTFKKFWHETIVVLAISIIALGGFVSFDLNSDLRASAQSLTQCELGAAIVGPTPYGQELVGDVYLEAYIPPGAVLGQTSNAIDSVKFFAFYPELSTWVNIGQATKSGSSLWFRNWDTSQAVANGPVEIVARAIAANGTCETEREGYFINDLDIDATDLRFELIKPARSSWVGNPNTSTTFQVRVFLEYLNAGTNVPSDVDITQDVYFEWSTNIGELDGDLSGPVVQFFSGPEQGDGDVVVRANFQDEKRTRKISIDVREATDSDFDGENFGNGEEDDESGGISTAPSISEDPELKDCIIQIYGNDYFKQVVKGERKLTFTELERVSKCFASSKYIIPSTVAPIEPDKIDEIPVDLNKAKVIGYEQAQDGKGEDSGVVFTGTAIPNSTIVLYIFSEPLVLTTTTDSDGNWTYVLEDPLEPGEHQIYVAVEDDDGNILRSEPVSFDLNQVASVNTNPSGLSLSLNLNDPETSSNLYYVSAVVAVLLVGFGSFVFIIRRKTSAVDESDDTTSA